jgi:hypothetical protein
MLIVSELEGIGFDREFMIQSIQNNKHNNATTTYFGVDIVTA